MCARKREKEGKREKCYEKIGSGKEDRRRVGCNLKFLQKTTISRELKPVR
jgi:hypothetical protein